MKMRKIVALLATICVSSSVFVANVSAAISTTEPVITATPTKMTNEEFKDFYAEDIPEGKEAWSIAFEVTNITDSLQYTKTGGTAAKPKYTGTALDNLEVFLTTTDAEAFANVDQDYSYIIDHALSAAPNEGFTSNGYSFNYSGNFIYPGAAATEGITDGSTSGFLTMCFLIKEGDTITFTLTDSGISLISYENSVISEQVNYSTADSTLSFAKDTITLGGSSEPTDPTGTVIAEKDGKKAVYSGYVEGSTIKGTTKFRINYTGDTEALKAKGTTKDIMRTADQILNGSIGEGTLTGKLHFGVLIDPAYVETDGSKFTVDVIN